MAVISAKSYQRSRQGNSNSLLLLLRNNINFAVLALLWSIACFIGGTKFSLHSNLQSNTDCNDEATVQERIKQSVRQALSEHHSINSAAADDTSPRFPDSIKDFARGMAVLPRDDFYNKFNLGLPLDPSKADSNDQVLLLYSSDAALPTSNAYASQEAISQTTIPSIDSIDEATENCDFLNIILTDHSANKRRQCIALFGQYEAFHIQKFMRLPKSDDGKAKLDSAAPLRFVNRGAQSSGRTSTDPPTLEATQQYWDILVPYLQSLPDVLNELRPIAAKAAEINNNTVIVLVCNQGQSELLLNFVCSARHYRHFDLSAILVFATDEETRDLMQNMGINVFYDETNYGRMPKQAARRYADKNFMAMMMAKVFCVQMAAMLGHDVLFQDVDVVWYKNPLEYFHNPSNPQDADFDVYFQDDGNHALYYAPYSANTGFYYVRHNDKTLNFLNSFLVSGNLIIGTKSHQIPLVALLQEHASMYGMRVKIFGRDGDDFPGGHAFHRRKDFMRDLFAGAVTPYIFHMSWTLNKDNKIKYFRQMGEWMVQDSCIQKTVGDIGVVSGSTLESTCCANEPIISCHYKDKPSKIPCRDSPAIDKGHPSFW